MNGIHFLLTYQCTLECDHCFLYCSPRSEGTFSLSQIKSVLQEAKKMGVEWIYYEGGEPFLYYPLLKEAVSTASRMGFKVGIVTNSYFAHSEEDAVLWLKPLVVAGLDDLNVSNDEFHFGDQEQTTADILAAAARILGLEPIEICIEAPAASLTAAEGGKGEPVVGGSTRFQGRAADLLTEGLPRRPWEEFNTCPYEELVTPERVHVDSFGNVHICQGISAGNMWEKPLAELMESYRAEEHPICGPLVRNGPAGLARELGIQPEPEYVDACHLCYSIRRRVLDTYPGVLEPRQVYGTDNRQQKA
ncbi:MAG: radical SAM protein [Anaerolineales bacterium]|nr:radical SAM protein [Anaerolineales bacterium]